MLIMHALVKNQQFFENSLKIQTIAQQYYKPMLSSYMFLPRYEHA
jgi:hypothetical protein